MLDRFARLLGASPTVAALVRRGAVRGGRKWVWALVIAVGNLPGAIGYLAAGRLMPEADVSGGASAAGGEAARRAVDALYGPRDQR